MQCGRALFPVFQYAEEMQYGMLYTNLLVYMKWLLNYRSYASAIAQDSLENLSGIKRRRSGSKDYNHAKAAENGKPHSTQNGASHHVDHLDAGAETIKSVPTPEICLKPQSFPSTQRNSSEYQPTAMFSNAILVTFIAALTTATQGARIQFFTTRDGCKGSASLDYEGVSCNTCVDPPNGTHLLSLYYLFIPRYHHCRLVCYPIF